MDAGVDYAIDTEFIPIVRFSGRRAGSRLSKV